MAVLGCLLCQPPCVADERPSITVRSVKPRPQRGTFVGGYGLTRDDFHWLAQLRGVRQAIPVREQAAVARLGDSARDVRLVGTVAGYAKPHELKMTRGRFLSAKDDESRENVAAISDAVARALLPPGSPLGRHIRVEGQYFTVVGVFAGGRDAEGDVFIPLATMQTLLGDVVISRAKGAFFTDRFELSRVELWLEDPRRVTTFAKAVERILQKSNSGEDYFIDTR